MTRTSYVAVALGLAGCLGAVSARGVRAQEVAPPKWRVAAGTELTQLGRFSTTGNLIGLLGREWQRPGSRMSLRLGLAYHRQVHAHAFADAFGCEATCRGEAREQIVALEGDAKFELSRGAVRPYVVSGLGIYRWDDVHRQNYTCNDGPLNTDFVCRANAGPLTRYDETRVGLGLHTGIGLAGVVGRTHVFGELRLWSPSNSPNRSWRMPFVFGVRF